MNILSFKNCIFLCAIVGSLASAQVIRSGNLIEVKVQEIMDITCDSSEIDKGFVSIDFMLSNGVTDLSSRIQTNQLLSAQQKQTIMMLYTLSTTYNKDFDLKKYINTQVVKKCHEVALSYFDRIKSIPDGLARIYIDDKNSVTDFFVYEMHFTKKIDFKIQAMKDYIQFNYYQILQLFKK